MSSEGYHEPIELLSEPTKNMHRAIVSLCEELEAVDWYQQRAEACTDAELAAVLTHNKNEEIEHAMMTLEWIPSAQPGVRRELEDLPQHQRTDHRRRETDDGGRRRLGIGVVVTGNWQPEEEAMSDELLKRRHAPDHRRGVETDR